jgi:hypothetical protein
METLENDSFPAGETVLHIREVVTRVAGIHMQFSLRSVYPEFRY